MTDCACNALTVCYNEGMETKTVFARNVLVCDLEIVRRQAVRVGHPNTNAAAVRYAINRVAQELSKDNTPSGI